jgi:hypothetical protein
MKPICDVGATAGMPPGPANPAPAASIAAS